jgi:hypothetical protein
MNIGKTIRVNRLLYKEIECTASNEWFHASGGVCPQTVLWEFGSVSPARTFVSPPPA